MVHKNKIKFQPKTSTGEKVYVKIVSVEIVPLEIKIQGFNHIFAYME